MSNKKSLEQTLNDITVSIVYNQLKTLALDCFEWTGLEDTEIKPIYIETALYEWGQALFFEHMYNVMCLPCAFGGDYNVYNQPLNYRAFGRGFSESFADTDSVNIRNNSLRTNMHLPLMTYACRIANIDRTADVNVRVCKTPVIIHTTDKNEFSMRNMFKKIDENAIALYLDKRFDPDNINVLTLTNNLREWFICPDLMDFRTTILNQALTFIGINNLPTDKKERLITDEANSNNDFVFNNIDERLKWREIACEEINKKFAMNLSVKLRHEPQEPEKQEIEKQEDDNNGEI